jgi:hypothetical protein
VNGITDFLNLQHVLVEQHDNPLFEPVRPILEYRDRNTLALIPIAIPTGRSDPDTIMRCHSLCAYYVEKCPDVWSRIEPLLKELLCDSDTTSIGHSSG